MSEAHAMIAEISAAQFQAAMYYSILLMAMLVLLLTGIGWAWTGAARVWRGGEHGPAVLIAAASTVGMAVLVGLALAALIGLLATGGRG